MANSTLSRRKLNSLTHRVSKDVLGTMLAQAFVLAKREGLTLRVVNLDGEQISVVDPDSDPMRINVNVSESVVRKSWVG